MLPPNLYDIYYWDNVPINAIVLGMEQTCEVPEDGTFRNLYYRKSEKQGCFLCQISDEDPLSVSPEEFISWKTLSKQESRLFNRYKQVTIIKLNGSSEDSVEEFDKILENYNSYINDEKETRDELHSLIEMYKGTALIGRLQEVCIKFGKEQKEKQKSVKPTLEIVGKK